MHHLQLKLTELMTERRLNASDIAKKAGICRNTVTSILNGSSTNPTTHTLKSIAAGLGVQMKGLIGEEDDSPIDQNDMTHTFGKERMIALRDIVSKTTDIIIEKNLTLSKDKFFEIINEVYNFTISEEPYIVDNRLIHYTLSLKRIKS